MRRSTRYSNRYSVDNSQLTAVFKELRKLGYFARQNFMCCQGCGWSAVPEGKEQKVVFYHAQDKSHLRDTNNLYIAWAGDGEEIRRTFETAGYEVEWDGSSHQRILIKNVY